MKMIRNKNLALFTGLFLVLGTIFLLVIQKFSTFLGHVSYYCQTLINNQIFPIPYFLSILPFGILSVILAVSIGKLLISNIKVQWLRYTLKSKISTDSSVKELIVFLGIQDKTVVVESEKHFAFCLGIRDPKIYISTGLINYLNKKELEAVLRHEQYHLENHDTFIMTIASIAHWMFPFFPLLGDLIKKYRIDREIKADTHAVTYMNDSSHLISALRKLLIYPTTPSFAFARIADEDTLEPRIHSLLKKEYSVRQFRIKHSLITLFFTVLLTAIFVAPVYANELHHDHYDVMMFSSQETISSCKNFSLE